MNNRQSLNESLAWRNRPRRPGKASATAGGAVGMAGCENDDGRYPGTNEKRIGAYGAADEAAIARIAADTRQPIDEVRRLYKSEFLALSYSARLQGFVSIITTKRVKAALRAGATLYNRAAHEAS